MTERAERAPSTTTVAAVLLGGAVLGALVMALVTPKTGPEVRATLRHTARRLRGRLRPAEAEDDDRPEAMFV